jgi:adenosylcobinamide kinase/adenosylcobinamide-phosphate guanylyltransferase
VFVATAEARDGEMRARIERHQRERGADFRTLEVPLALAAALRDLESADVVVIDCLTLWLANLLLRDEPQEHLLAAVDELLGVLATRPFHCVIVTNEVGMGIVPESALGRAFRDACGLAHQRLAREADEVYFAALGMLLRLKPGPVAAVEATA